MQTSKNISQNTIADAPVWDRRPLRSFHLPPGGETGLAPPAG